MPEEDLRSFGDHPASAHRLAEEEGKIDLACNEYEQALLKTNDPVDLINIHHNIGHLILFRIAGAPKFIPTKDDLSDDELKKAEKHFKEAFEIFKQLPLEKKQKLAELYENLEDKRKLASNLIMQKADNSASADSEAHKHYTKGLVCLIKAGLNEDAPLHRYSKASEEGVLHLEEAIKLGLPLKDEAAASAFLGSEYHKLGAEYGEIEQLKNGQSAPLIFKGTKLLERALMLDSENHGEFLTDHDKKAFMEGLSSTYALESTTLSCDNAISFLQEKLKLCDDMPIVHFTLGNLYMDKNMLIQALLSFENAIEAKTYGEGDIKYVEKARYNIETIKSSEILVEEIKRKKDKLESEIKNLDKDRNKKFDEAGKIAYNEYLKNKPDQPLAVVTKWNEIEDIDSLIAKNKQDLSDLKQREKKSGFLAKLGDSIASTAKHGKLKLDVYNLERKKNRIITEFGSVLYDSHKKGDNTLEELSSIWQEIDEIEQQIRKNEEEIAILRKYV